MIETKVGKGIECRLINRGTPSELAEDVGNIVRGIYTGFLRANNPGGGAFFRTLLQFYLCDPESPVWELNESAHGVSMTLPNIRRETPPESGGPSA